MQEKEFIISEVRMDKSVPLVTVWHHSAEPRDAKTMTIGTDLPIRTSHTSDSYILTPAKYRIALSGVQAARN